MKILFLTNLLPYPLDNGGKIKTYSSLEILSEAGHEIDLVCFSENQDSGSAYSNELLKVCNQVEQVYQKLTTAENKKYMIGLAVKSLFSKYSFGLYKYQSFDMYEKLKKMIMNNHYDCVYYDHLQLCIYKDYIDALLPNCKTILDEHNCETLIMKRNAQDSKNIAKRLFLNIEAKKLQKFEVSSINSVDRSIVLSGEDYNELRKMCSRDFEHAIIPIAVQDNGLKKKTVFNGKHINILFVGTLTWEPNNRGVIWFLENVVPLLNKNNVDFTLYIVGKNASNEMKMLTEQYDNIIITGYVDSIDEYYDKCHCMVVPLFIGSGQRVKIIEAYSKGMPIISTSIGAEGLKYSKNESILIADNAEQFNDSICSLNKCGLHEKLSVNGRKLYEEYYSKKTISDALISAISII